MFSDADRTIEPVALAQHGAFSRRQALAAGHTPRMIDRRVAARAWLPRARGVYALAAHPRGWLQDCWVAVLAHPEAWINHRSAAALHGLSGFARAGRVTVGRRPSRGNRSAVAVVTQTSLRQTHRVDGLPVSSVALTLVELAASVGPHRLARAFEEAVLTGRTSVDAVADWYVRLEGSRRAGLPALRALLEEYVDGGAVPESELEAVLFRAMDDPRIPPVDRQPSFPWTTDDPRRADGCIRPWTTLLEADGRRWHARLQAMEVDRRRDREALRHGYVTFRFGAGDLHSSPEACRLDVIGSAVSRGLATPGLLVLPNAPPHELPRRRPAA
ncbi:MAG: type IV toxin-antitoxin system AbiEi family antitoxin domain-containing protein [Acidimicrobiales bacterium]